MQVLASCVPIYCLAMLKINFVWLLNLGSFIKDG